MRYLKALFFSVLLIGLMTGSAFAQAQLNAGNTGVAAEKIPPAAPYPAAAFQTAYQTGGPIAVTTVLKLDLSSGAFGANAAGDVKMCNGAIQVGATVAANLAGATSINDINLTTPLASGTAYYFTNALCNAGIPPFAGISINAGTLAGTLVNLTVNSITIPGDPNVFVTAPIFNVKNQFAATLTSVTSKLDFADNQETFLFPAPIPANPPRTPSNTESQAGLRVVSDDTIQDKILLVGAAPCAWNLGALDGLRSRVTGNLTGILAVEYQRFGVAGAFTYLVTAADRTNGNATLLVPGNLVEICKSTDVTPFNNALELTAANVAGTSILAGIRTAQITLLGGGLVAAGYSRDLVAAGANSHDIQLDATQFYIPLVGSNLPSRETYIKIQSKNTLAGANGVKVAILTNDGSVSTIYDAGIITAGTPMTITGAQLEAFATAQGKTVDGTAGFAVIVTVNAPEADVFAYANMIDAAGPKRVPVKTVGGNIVE